MARQTKFPDAGRVARRLGEVENEVRWMLDPPLIVHTSTIENAFAVFKRGMLGVYQHCGEAHPHRYLAEFDCRYNRRTALQITDTERHDQLLAMIEGKRLTYRRVGEARHA